MIVILTTLMMVEGTLTSMGMMMAMATKMVTRR